jgi:hypothetical protein
LRCVELECLGDIQGEVNFRLGYAAARLQVPPVMSSPEPTTITVAGQGPVRHIENIVIAKIQERGDVGLRKYGLTMDRRDLSLSKWAKHAQDEMLDGAQYLERVIQAGTLLEQAAALLAKFPETAETKAWLAAYNEQFQNESV